jgi:hypothetical protein
LKKIVVAFSFYHIYLHFYTICRILICLFYTKCRILNGDIYTILRNKAPNLHAHLGFNGTSFGFLTALLVGASIIGFGPQNMPKVSLAGELPPAAAAKCVASGGEWRLLAEFSAQGSATALPLVTPACS